MNRITIQQCLKKLTKHNLSYSFYGDKNVHINSPKQVNIIDSGNLGYLMHDNILEYTSRFNKYNLVILNRKIDISELPDGNYIFSDNPKLAFIVIGKIFLPKIKLGIHDSAIIHRNAKIGDNCFIGAYSIIDKNVVIGDDVFIEEHCVLKNNIHIGNNVIIHSGCKIGNPGLGSIKDEKGKYHDFPHFGGIKIENNISIGDNTIINQGTLSDTIIREGTKIGPNNWIAHGVNIGTNCFIAQSITIAGSVKIGDDSQIWGNSSIIDGIEIGRGAIIGMSSAVTKNVPEGETWIGLPAKKISES